MSFKAIITTKNDENKFITNIFNISEQDIPPIEENEVLVKIKYSSLNYKDALAITAKSPIARISPLVLGIDGVGEVIYDKSKTFSEGSKVILNGFSVGEKYYGCFAQYAKLKANWLIPLPNELSDWQSMAIGTAGYTASLCVLKFLTYKIPTENTKILVSGATGGVGSIVIMLLSKLGYYVVATTGKKDQEEYLKQLGAKEIVTREYINENNRPLQKELWSAVIDTVGSKTLANLCAQTKYNGIVVCCGLAQGMDLNMTVAPFILRGITLAGVDSVMAGLEIRKQAYQFLSKNLDLNMLEKITKTISLEESFNVAERMINGQTFGRYIIDVNL